MTASTQTIPTSATPAASVLGKPRPLTSVILRSVASGLLYYGYYKWMLQDELKAHVDAINESLPEDSSQKMSVWSGAVCLVPFVLGIAVPQLLVAFDSDVPSWFGSLSFLGVLWIYIVQYRLYREINRLYVAEGLNAPLVCWWIIVPGLNLIVGLRQIHFLSEYWARLAGVPAPDPVASRLPFLSGNG